MSPLVKLWPPDGGGGGNAVKVGASISAINAMGSKADGDMAIIRLGTWPNQIEVWLRWNASEGVWISEEEILITQGDSWAMDLGNRTGTQLVDWSDVDNAIPYGKAYDILVGDHNLSASNFNVGTATGVITMNNTLSPHSFPFTDSSSTGFYVQIRDNYISHTGRTSTTLTGCAVVEGSRGTIPGGEYVTQGFPGGWGFVSTPLIFADELMAAGLTLQERLTALMNSAPPRTTPSAIVEKKLLVAPYWYEYDPGDGHQPNIVPPSGGLGVSATLTSLAGTGGTDPANERSFYVTENGWTDWPLTDPVKRFLLPKIVGKMEAGAFTSGSILDAKLSVRWVG